MAAALDESAPVMPDAHLSMEAPFVFSGAGVPPDMTAVVAHLKLESTHMVSLQPVVLPPGKQKKSEPKTQTVAANSAAANSTQEKVGMFSKIGAFFASIFH